MNGTLGYALTLDPSRFTRGIGGALGALDNMQSKARALSGTILKIAAPVAAIAGVASLGGALGKAINKAAELQTLETAFIPLLGGAEEAKARIKELSQFAAATPFELPQIAKASRTLETLTRGALSTGKGLTLVGDVASGTGTAFDEVAVTIGRLYDGLDSGRPVGEALARLQELGVISGDTRGQLEAMQKEGKKGPEVWAIAEQAMGRFTGSMQLQSQTWGGLMSTLQDNIGLTFAAFGEPVLDALTPLLGDIIGTTGTLTEKAASFGESVGGAIRLIRAAFSSGDISSIAEDALVLAFQKSVNFLYRAGTGAMGAIGQFFAEQVKNGLLLFEIVTTPDFWKGMGGAIEGVFLGVLAYMQDGVANLVASVRPVAALFGKGASIDRAYNTLKKQSAYLKSEAADSFSEAGSKLEQFVDPVMQRMKEQAKNIGQAYAEGFANAGDVLDTSEREKSLAASYDKIKKIAVFEKEQQDAAKKAASDAVTQKKEAAKIETDAAAENLKAAKETAKVQSEAATGALKSARATTEAEKPRRAIYLKKGPKKEGLQTGSLSNLTLDEQFRTVKSSLKDKLEAPRLSLNKSFDALNQGALAADPARASRKAAAEESRRVDPLVALVRSIDQKFANLAVATA